MARIYLGKTWAILRAVSHFETFRRILGAHEEAVRALSNLEQPLVEAADRIARCLKSGKKVMFCGNGGSAADAQHLAAELTGRFQKDRDGLPGLALHTDTSALTSIANDYGFEEVYARQVQAHGRPGDVLVALSTSGNSPNILRAVERARTSGIAVVGLTGRSGGLLRDQCEVWIGVPSDVTARVQECHILIGHFLCEVAEAEF